MGQTKIRQILYIQFKKSQLAFSILCEGEQVLLAISGTFILARGMNYWAFFYYKAFILVCNRIWFLFIGLARMKVFRKQKYCRVAYFIEYIQRPDLFSSSSFFHSMSDIFFLAHASKLPNLKIHCWALSQRRGISRTSTFQFVSMVWCDLSSVEWNMYYIICSFISRDCFFTLTITGWRLPWNRTRQQMHDYDEYLLKFMHATFHQVDCKRYV